MTGTIDQIGTDINQIREMGIEHIIFGYAFSPIGPRYEEDGRDNNTAC
jgi:hypothetical protein